MFCTSVRKQNFKWPEFPKNTQKNKIILTVANQFRIRMTFEHIFHIVRISFKWNILH